MVNTVVFIRANQFSVVNTVCAPNYNSVFCINLKISIFKYLVFKIDLRMYCEVKTDVLLLLSSLSPLCRVSTHIFLRQTIIIIIIIIIIVVIITIITLMQCIYNYIIETKYFSRLCLQLFSSYNLWHK